MSDSRIQIIRDRLITHFFPDELEVIDDSAQHIGHAGSQGGAGHYTIKIKANCFLNKTRVTIHREIYNVLADLIPNEIHALQIKILGYP